MSMVFELGGGFGSIMTPKRRRLAFGTYRIILARLRRTLRKVKRRDVMLPNAKQLTSASPILEAAKEALCKRVLRVGVDSATEGCYRIVGSAERKLRLSHAYQKLCRVWVPR
jgi:hypothetical protein